MLTAEDERLLPEKVHQALRLSSGLEAQLMKRRPEFQMDHQIFAR